MAKRGDLLVNRVTGERVVVLRGDEDGGGAAVISHLTISPGGAVVGEHFHPGIDERFVVLSGKLGVKVAGEESTLGPGEEASAPAGIPHDWWNAGDGEAEVLVHVDPPDPRFGELIATLFGLANAGKVNSKGMPSIFQLALTGTEFRDVIQFMSPPPPVQRVVLPALGAIGRMRGFRGVYPEYLEVHGQVEPDPKALEAAGLA